MANPIFESCYDCNNIAWVNEVILFADNTTAFLKSIKNYCINLIFKFNHLNALGMNTSKTQLISFHAEKLKNNVKINLQLIGLF